MAVKRTRKPYKLSHSLHENSSAARMGGNDERREYKRRKLDGVEKHTRRSQGTSQKTRKLTGSVDMRAFLAAT